MTQQLPPGQGPIDPRSAQFLRHRRQAPVASARRPRQGPPGPPGPWMHPPPFFPPPRKGGVLRGIIWTVLIVGLGISIFLNIFLVADSVSISSTSKQTIIVSGDSSSKIAVVPIDGLITDSSLTQFNNLLNDVEKDTSVKALVIEIDTPGGSASTSDEMYHRLEQFKKKMTDDQRKVPVVISMRGMATSGGYYVACAGDYIIAEPGTLTGNIGVLMPQFNFSGLMKKYGVEETTITSTTEGHSYKDAGSMFKPADPDDTKYLQGLIDATFAQFKQAVVTGRSGKINGAADIFSGKAFVASDAMARGLIDAIGYPDDAYDYAAKQAGITNKTVVKYSEPENLLQTLLSQSRFAAPSASSSNSVNVNGVNIDGQALRDLMNDRVVPRIQALP